MRGGAGGEIVEVEGGHIVRSTGRKDRHSKVCTAKGPRDRRVRLSAHTAIQFYDVQDRLGYDRPSKAVDWLIKKAKTAIDELAKLPPWNPIATVTTNNNNNNNSPNVHHNEEEEEEEEETENTIRRRVMMADGGSPSRPIVGNGDGINLDHEGGGSGGSGFFSPSLEVDIADTISSFFPTKTTSSLPIRFQSYTPDLLSRTSNNNNNNNQDLRLSLQSLQDPILLHQHQAQNHHHHHHHQNQNEHMLFSGTTALGFDGMVAWNAGTDTGGHGSGDGGGGGGGFVFNTPSPSPSPLTAPALLFGQSQYLSQRGPLQSSNNPSIRAWIDAPSITAAAATTVADHHHVLHHYLSPAMMHQSVPGIGFASGGFSGFRVPARIQGEYEEHDGVSDKPSSASSDSRH